MQVDASDDQRVASLGGLLQALRQCRSPSEMLLTIRRGLRVAHGPATRMLLSTQGLQAGQYRLLKLDLEDDDDGVHDDADPWQSATLPIHVGGVVAEIIARPKARIVCDVDWTTDPLFAKTLAGYSSVMALPADGDRVPISWVLFLKRDPDRFTNAELADGMLRIAMIGTMLESRMLADDLARVNAQIDRDMRQAGQFQRSLLPDPLPQIAGLEIAASYQPSSRAGGDLYDFFRLDDEPNMPERWCVLIADASGHGLAAALMITMFQSILRAHPPGVAGPAELLAYVNRQLCRKHVPGFVTAFLGLYEPHSRRFSYACAGHPPPLIKHVGDGLATQMNVVASVPLGIDETATFIESTVHAHPGFTALLYTDGITESWSAGHEMFTAERLEREFLAYDACPTELVERLCELVRHHEQGRCPADDQTVVAIAGVWRRFPLR